MRPSRRGGRRPSNALRAPAAVARRRAGRAVHPSRPPAHRPRDERLRRHRRAPSSGCAPRRCTSASRRRCRPTIRRGCSATPGSARRSQSRSTFGSSSTTAAGAPTPITSARIRRPSRSGDLDLIHRVWLDAVKAVGPHVHHHDVVRAALTQMEQQLSGPQRDDALAAIREVARPADELAAAAARARLRAAARHGAQPARRRRRRRARRRWPRRPGRRLPGAAAQGCRGRLRVPVARSEGSAAQGDGAGGYRRAAQQHGAGRPHDVPRGTARGGHAPAAVAAHAGRTRGRRSRCSGTRKTPSAA